MPERDLRIAYRVGFEDALDAVQEIIRRHEADPAACCRGVRELVDRVRTGKARRILADLMGEA